MNNNITVRGEFRIELSQLQFEEIVVKVNLKMEIELESV